MKGSGKGIAQTWRARKMIDIIDSIVMELFDEDGVSFTYVFCVMMWS